MKTYVLAAFAAISALLLLPALTNAGTLEDIQARGKVQIAIDTSVPPYGSLDANMQPEGYDVDVANMIAKDLGVPLEIVPVTGPNRVTYLLSNKADLVVSTFSVTAERAKSIAFTNPYGSNQVWVIGKKAEKVNQVADLTKKTVGVVRGAIQDIMLTRVAPEGVTIRRYEDDATAAAAFLTGQVDFIATGGQIGNALIQKDNGASEQKVLLGVSPYSIGVRKGDADFLHLINTFIYTHQLNGDIDTITKKWIGGEAVKLPTF